MSGERTAEDDAAAAREGDLKGRGRMMPDAATVRLWKELHAATMRYHGIKCEAGDHALFDLSRSLMHHRVFLINLVAAAERESLIPAEAHAPAA